MCCVWFYCVVLFLWIFINFFSIFFSAGDATAGGCDWIPLVLCRTLSILSFLFFLPLFCFFFGGGSTLYVLV